MKPKTIVLSLWLTIGLAVALMGVPHVALAQGGVTHQICVALDGSGSIDYSDFDLQINGLANAIADPAIIPQDGTVELSVVQFGTADLEGARVEVSATVIDSAATAAAVASTIRAMAQGVGQTPMDAGINLCTAQITSSSRFTGAAKQVMNVSTDGYPTDPAAALAASAAAKAAGVDELDAEAIGLYAGVEFLKQLVFPQPAIVVPPGAYKAGFVRVVASFADFEEAMREKLETVIEDSYGEPSLGTIRGTVFEDSNCDGVFSVGEATVSGVVFDLRSPGGLIGSGWTGDDGTYGPAGLTPSDYWIDIHVPEGDFATTPTTRGPLAVRGNAVIGQDFGLARPEWCPAPAETVAATGETATPPPEVLPVTGGRLMVVSLLTVLIGLLSLAAGSWLDRLRRTILRR